MVLLLCACGKSYPTTEKILKDFEDEIFSEIGEIVSVEIVDEKETKDGVKQNVLVTVEIE